MSRHPQVVIHLHRDGEKYLSSALVTRNKVKFHSTVPVEQWPQFIKDLQLDIGLAYLSNSVANRCKSPIKYFEYALSRAAGVYSAVVYQDVVKDGQTGLIAKDYFSVEQQLSNLIESENKRL